MMDLVIHLETPLKNSNYHVQDEVNPVLDRSWLSPGWSSRLLIEEALMEHLPQNFVVQLGTIMVQDL